MHGKWFPALRFEAHMQGFRSDRKTTQRTEGNPRFLEMTWAKMKMKLSFAFLTCSLVHIPLTAGHNKWAVVGQFKGPFPRRATHCTDNQRYMVQGTLPSLEKCKCMQILPHEKMQIISLCSKTVHTQVLKRSTCIWLFDRKWKGVTWQNLKWWHGKRYVTKMDVGWDDFRPFLAAIQLVSNIRS